MVHHRQLSDTEHGELIPQAPNQTDHLDEQHSVFMYEFTDWNGMVVHLDVAGSGWL